MERSASSGRVDVIEAMVGGYPADLQAVLAPPLLYKAVFLGEWFEAVARQETSPAVRAALTKVSQDTLREAIELVTAARPWADAPPPPDATEDLAGRLRRLLLQDLIATKEGSTEAVLVLAMRAPTRALRDRLVELADRDRLHADALRALLRADERPRVRDPVPPAIGAHVGRDGGSMRRAVETRLGRLHEIGEVAVRLVVSADALRHLRDEGAVEPDGTILGLPADVDFGWRGDCFAFITDERVRLAELLTKERTGH